MCAPDPTSNQSMRCAEPVGGFGADSVPTLNDVAVETWVEGAENPPPSRQFTSGVGEIPVSLERSAGPPE